MNAPDGNTGLSIEEAARRLARDGPNALPSGARRSWRAIVWQAAREPMFVHSGGHSPAALFSGTLVVRGHGILHVTATGAATAIGGIGQSLANVVPQRSPL